jgi:hypothetical protein
MAWQHDSMAAWQHGSMAAWQLIKHHLIYFCFSSKIHNYEESHGILSQESAATSSAHLRDCFTISHKKSNASDWQHPETRAFQ